MIESLINPKRLEKGTWKMFFIGILYASLSLILVHIFFGTDPVLSKFAGLMVVLFCVMFSLPFMYNIIKKEEQVDEVVEGFRAVWQSHKKAIYALMWLFLGFVVAFSFWHVVLNDTSLLNAQIETYCMINDPGNMDGCYQKYIQGKVIEPTGSATSSARFMSILKNNIYVMIFTLIFSLIFGAGAIFVLAWNASVIAGAIGIFTEHSLARLPIGLGRYMIHGIPEIATYFITALAGGILGAAIIKNGINDKKFFHVLENVVILLFFALIILIVAGLIEVYITPNFF